jgi:hypothetical protein
MQQRSVSVGDQVYAREDGEAFGAVRQIDAKALLVFVEGWGDAVIRAESVVAIHDGKVVVDPATLDGPLQEAIAHAHEAETE